MAQALEITITYERSPQTVTRFDGYFKLVPVRTVYDYKVLIDGWHRATFRNQAVFHQAGFYLEDRTGKHLASKFHMDPITRADFDEVVKRSLAELPTVAEAERWRMIVEAEKDNRAWDDQRERYRASIHRQMLSEALTQYLDNVSDIEEPSNYERDKLDAARKHLDQINAVIAAGAAS